jgi:hypothetical protein
MDTKYYSRLTRQNGVWSTVNHDPCAKGIMLTPPQPTVAVNGVKAYDATSQWAEEKWLEWFEWVPFQPVIGDKTERSI